MITQTIHEIHNPMDGYVRKLGQLEGKRRNTKGIQRTNKLLKW